ncbi:MAG: hypothetical protein JSV84_14010 [Gemmatimonadota bacterium]|nr:MAG: hypothetical protein JSV84_14010 [Gemmatimonadota bacterium]
MFIRFLLYLLLIYIVYRLIKSLFGNFFEHRRSEGTEVGGATRSEQPIRSDIDEAEIEDATFEEIEEDSREKP